MERLKDKTLSGRQRQRLSAVQLGLEGELSLPQIARAVGAGARSVSRWHGLYREEGLERLVQERRGRGPKSQLDEQSADKLRQKLAEGTWRRAEDARQWLQKQLGRKLTLSVTYKYLGKVEARLKVPRPLHAGKDPQAAETFRQTLSDKLHAKEIALESPVHLWVIDEMRFGLQPVTRRVWTLRGVEVSAPVNPRYRWGYTFGALEVCGDGAEFFHTDGVSQEATGCFLDQLAASDPQAIHIVIQEGAGFHLGENHERLPANVREVTLPAYSPELNPIERLWGIIKDRICNRIWEDLQELTAAINGVLREYWKRPKLVRSLIGQGWLHTQANASSPNVLAE
jgi:transposase